MKTVMSSIDELMRTYRDNPERNMRCGSVSCGDGYLYSYGLPIARFYRYTPKLFYVLHDPKSSVTTNKHVRKIHWWLTRSCTPCIREVPSLHANEEEIGLYFTERLNRIYTRYNHSKRLTTAFEYFLTYHEYAKHTDRLPEIPGKIRLFAELEGWNA